LGPSEVSKPNPPAPEAGSSERFANALALMEEDPGAAIQLLRSLAASHPGDAQIQGNLLAAIYHTRNAVEFERAYFDANSSGLNMAALLKVPSFKAAIQEETRLHRNRSLYKVLPGELLTRMLNGLAPAPESKPPR
jgi:hypothetical protein